MKRLCGEGSVEQKQKQKKMNDRGKNKESLQTAKGLLDEETRAYLKAWVDAFAEGHEHEEAKHIADNKLKETLNYDIRR